MRHAHDLPATTRRRVLAGVTGAVATGLGVTLPGAHARATLAADLEVVDTAIDATGDVGIVVFELASRADEPIEPVATVWGVGRQTQHPWEVVEGPEAVAPGATARYRIHAPGEHEAVRVVADQPAQLTVYDRGREARAVEHFTPTPGGGGPLPKEVSGGG